MASKGLHIPIFTDEHCVGCHYYRLLTTGDQYYCSYIFVEDKKRPCDPGKDCTVRVKRRGKKDAKV